MALHCRSVASRRPFACPNEYSMLGKLSNGGADLLFGKREAQQFRYAETELVKISAITQLDETPGARD